MSAFSAVVVTTTPSWRAFFSSVKSEVADRFDSFSKAKMALFDYVDVFYNQRRRHSRLGRISPAAFERRATQAA
jgi:putative transposase